MTTNNYFKGEFKIGLRLKLRTKQDLLDNYGYLFEVPWSVSEPMEAFLGSVVTVGEESFEHMHLKGCSILEDRSTFNWHREMFAPGITERGNTFY